MKRSAAGVFSHPRHGPAAVGPAATALVGVHPLADLSLQIPAVAVCCAAVMGAGVVQWWSSREKG